jgi:tRNA1Val (adenine37-N6)-methyltransferase
MLKNSGLKESERLDNLQCGELRIIQDKSGYTFTTDAVLLANYAKAAAGERVADLGTGSGVIPLLMSAKTKAKEIVGIEIQARLADMAARSVLLNGLEDRVKIVCGDMRGLPRSGGRDAFDVVVANPPYKLFHGEKEGAGEREICKSEVLITLAEVIETASLLLKYGGRFYIVIKGARLADLLYFMRKYEIEPKRLIPVQPTPDKPVDTVLAEGRKKGASGLIFEKPLVILDTNGEYTDELKKIYKQ